MFIYDLIFLGTASPNLKIMNRKYNYASNKVSVFDEKTVYFLKSFYSKPNHA